MIEQVLSGYVAPFVSTGLVLWFMQDRFAKSDAKVDRLHERLDRIEHEQSQAALGVATTCATRGELKEIDRRVDAHERRLTRVEERRGRPAGPSLSQGRCGGDAVY